VKQFDTRVIQEVYCTLFDVNTGVFMEIKGFWDNTPYKLASAFTGLEGFFSYLTGKRRSRRSSEFVLDFLKVIVTVIVCLAPVTCRTRGVWCNVGRASGGAGK